MCREASFVLTQDNVYWSLKSDSHETIISEHGLREGSKFSPNILRVELFPKDRDLTIPIENWEYRVDQDILPAWSDTEKDEQRIRRAAMQWLKVKVVLPGEVREKVGEGQTVLAVYGTVWYVCGNGVVQNVYGNGVVQNVFGNGVVQNVYDSGVVQNVSGNGVVQTVSGNGVVQKVYGNGVVQNVSGNGVVQTVSGNGVVQKVYDSGVVQNVHGNGVVQKVYDSGVVQKVYGNGVVQKVYGNGVVQKVYDNGVVQKVYGNGVVQNVSGNGVVQKVYDSGVVQKVYGNGVVRSYTLTCRPEIVGPYAVLLDMSGDRVVCTTEESNVQTQSILETTSIV